MSLTLPKDNFSEFELTPAATFIATCYRVIDLGTQQVEWQGKIKRQYKIMLSWEFTEEKMKDGRPFTANKRYTLSSSDKASLRIDLESWRGVAFKDTDFGNFDIGVLIGKSCLMGIVHETVNTKTYANISSILRLPKGLTAQPLINPTVRFDLSNFSQEVYDSFSDNLKATIAKSPEYQQIMGHEINELDTKEYHVPPDLDDSIPF